MMTDKSSKEQTVMERKLAEAEELLASIIDMCQQVEPQIHCTVWIVLNFQVHSFYITFSFAVFSVRRRAHDL